MDKKFETKASKALSYLLRHDKTLERDAEGYSDVDVVLRALEAQSYPITFEQLIHIVNNDEKGRYSMDETNCYIRANQGHSVEGVEEVLKSANHLINWASIFYHGTSIRNLKNIAHMGLSKMTRTHVHLSTDRNTAVTVGLRHCGNQYSQVVVLEIDAFAMREAGHDFFVSDNEVFLIEEVPPQFIRVVSISLEAFKG